jgi:hypothetical protein
MKFHMLLIFAAVAISFLGCSKKRSPSEQNINIYMIASEGTSYSGKTIGCNDVLVPVSKTVTSNGNIIEEAINSLLAEKDSDDLKNYVKGPQLILFQVNLAGGVADIYFKGDFLITGACDIPRIKEQITETIKQFADIKKANTYINNQSLDSYLKIAKDGFK